MPEKICDYRLRAALDNIELPEGMTEIAFSDFTIRECPNMAQPVPFTDENGDIVDVDWVYPEEPDQRFPVCDYYLETNLRAEKGHGWSESECLLAWCLTRLRLFKSGRVWGTLYRVDEVVNPAIRHGGDISESLRRRPTRPPTPPLHSGLITSFRHVYKIGQEDVDELRKFVEHIGKVSGKDFEIAIRRFHQSFDRDLPDDQALDLFIALESLLSDDSEAIGYKIALRASHLIGRDTTDKININSFLKKAYKERSGVVHGKTSSTVWLRSESHGLGKNIDILENIVVRVLRTLLDQACNSNVLKPPNLDQFLFFGH